ncbi:hypothetical protein KI387_021813, partial [Taxus chinensis]
MSLLTVLTGVQKLLCFSVFYSCILYYELSTHADDELSRNADHERYHDHDFSRPTDYEISGTQIIILEMVKREETMLGTKGRVSMKRDVRVGILIEVMIRYGVNTPNHTTMMIIQGHVHNHQGDATTKNPTNKQKDHDEKHHNKCLPVWQPTRGLGAPQARKVNFANGSTQGNSR